MQRRCISSHQYWCPGAESNHRHADFQSTALPTELPGLSWWSASLADWDAESQAFTNIFRHAMLLPMVTPKKSLRIQELLRRLKKSYGDAECALTHKNAFELLVATILSAQCTDVRVNMVTPALFKKYPSPQALAAADPTDVESLVRTTGFFRNKAKNIISMSQRLNAAYAGEVPKTMEDLLTLPGVARQDRQRGAWRRLPHSARRRGRYPRQTPEQSPPLDQTSRPGESRTRLDGSDPTR